jgi:hypothetical protein
MSRFSLSRQTYSIAIRVFTKWYAELRPTPSAMATDLMLGGGYDAATISRVSKARSTVRNVIGSLVLI